MSTTAKTVTDAPCAPRKGKGVITLGCAELAKPRYCSKCYGTGVAGMTMERLEAARLLRRRRSHQAPWARIVRDAVRWVAAGVLVAGIGLGSVAILWLIAIALTTALSAFTR